MIYETARYANAEHTFVIGTDALGNTETVPADYTLFRQPDDGIAGFTARGGVIADYVAPEVVPPVLAPSLYAVAQLSITPGDVAGIDVNSRFSAALYIDVGLYYLFFAETQPDTSYLAKAYDDASRVRVSEKAEDYIGVTATDYSGVPTDPAEISVEIIRVG